jgi:uridine phosphorylase
LRLNIQDESLNSKMDNFKFEENRITNLEETAAIYALFGTMHYLNAIIAIVELSALILIKQWTN